MPQMPSCSPETPVGQEGVEPTVKAGTGPVVTSCPGSWGAGAGRGRLLQPLPQPPTIGSITTTLCSQRSYKARVSHIQETAGEVRGTVGQV
ncbi:hypothetical protein Y1Q_0020320 [Alligator mississippiensis]|uniref:Uncharacterized protein n=1 Tax=Alligator mississippiensis TaxID=8496 RepID=A0A151NBD9_ALLMI|nr:hypothetical protein Y1Q_0020320 [Alligator mississippiensis]